MKKITAKVGEYQKDGQTKGRYVDIGVIMSNENGEYVMIDPTVNLAGVLLKQQALAASKGKNPGESVLCSVFDNSNQVGYQQPSHGAQHAPQPQQVQQPQNFDNDDFDVPF